VVGWIGGHPLLNKEQSAGVFRTRGLSGRATNELDRGAKLRGRLLAFVQNRLQNAELASSFFPWFCGTGLLGKMTTRPDLNLHRRSDFRTTFPR